MLFTLHASSFDPVAEGLIIITVATRPTFIILIDAAAEYMRGEICVVDA